MWPGLCDHWQLPRQNRGMAGMSALKVWRQHAVYMLSWGIRCQHLQYDKAQLAGSI